MKEPASPFLANRRSERHFSSLQFFGDTLDGPVGYRPRSLRRGLVEDSLSLVVHAQKRIAVDPAYVPFSKGRTSWLMIGYLFAME